jgi:hypothetical protein
VISIEIVLDINLNSKIMWIPITIDEYVKIYLQENPDEKEKVLRVRIEAAIDDYKNGIKCQCGKDIWIVGSASSPFGCFSCISGRDFPEGDYEIEGFLDKRDIDGRININFMDPIKINGIFDDDGYMVNMDSIIKPALCMSCLKNLIDDWDENLLCDMNRADQSDQKEFKCGAYEKL